MKRLNSLGAYLISVAVTGFGITELVQQKFLAGPFPFPMAGPYHLVAIDALGLFLVGAGMLMMVQTVARWAYVSLAILFGIVFLFPHLFLLLGALHNGNQWTATMETLALATGIFLVRPKTQSGEQTFADVVCQYLFVFCLVVFGIQHFQYAAYIESLIPHWIPSAAFWTYVTRFGFLLAAISLALGIQVRLAFTLLGAMFMIWVLVLHLPRTLTMWSVEAEWTSLFIALAIGGISFRIATAIPFRQNRVVSTARPEPLQTVIGEQMN